MNRSVTPVDFGQMHLSEPVIARKANAGNPVVSKVAHHDIVDLSNANLIERFDSGYA
jgi:hypothetical protein